MPIDFSNAWKTGARIINTGIAHKKAGVGQIGAGITTAPMECFNDALAALAKNLQGMPETRGGVS